MLHWFKRKAWPLVSRTVTEWNSDDGGLLAASLSFYTAFSFFPLVLVLLSMVGFILTFSADAQEAQSWLLSTVARQTSPQMALQLETILAGVQTNANVGGWLGLGTLLFGAIGIFSNMDVAFARIWKTRDLPEQHSGWLGTIRRVLFTRLKAFLVVLALGLFVAATFFTSIVLSTIGAYVQNFVMGDRFWSLVQIGVGMVLNIIFFTLTYRLFSLRPTSWWECLKGGIMAGVFWEVGRQGLTYYLTRSSYGAYGIVGSFIALMVWVYYAWTVLFFCAEYVQVSYRLRVARTVEDVSGAPKAPMVVD